MSPKNCSLAFEECVKDLERDQCFEPDLKVILNARYAKSSFAQMTDNVVQVKGRITVSF